MKSFSELTARLKSLPVDEWRKEAPAYLEFVLSAHHLSGIYPLLGDFFGPPFKPPGVAPTAEASRRASAYGGIEKQQTLYYLEKDGLSHCAMIWPWRDHTRATVKVAQGNLPLLKPA